MEKAKSDKVLDPAEQIRDHDYDPKRNLGAKTLNSTVHEKDELQERGVGVIDARVKNHGGIKPGDKVEHPEHGKGEVMHLDHVHDEVVFKADGAIVGAHHSTLKKVTESMQKQDIVRAILSKDASRVAEAKVALKELLTQRAQQFRSDSSKFVAQSLFESTQLDETGEASWERKARLKDVSSALHDLHFAKKAGRKTYVKNHSERIKTQHGEEALSHHEEYSKAHDKYEHHSTITHQLHHKYAEEATKRSGGKVIPSERHIDTLSKKHPDLAHHHSELNKAIKHLNTIEHKAKEASEKHRAANPNIPAPK